MLRRARALSVQVHEFVKNAVGVVLMSARCAAEAVGGGRANQTVLFRTTPTGHPNCLNASAPLSREAARARALFGGFDAEAQEVRQWHWPLFEAYNVVARRAVGNCTACGCVGRGRLGVLDVAPLSNTRPDLHDVPHVSKAKNADPAAPPHIDCLHWRPLGKEPTGSMSDWWILLLYNVVDALFPAREAGAT